MQSRARAAARRDRTSRSNDILPRASCRANSSKTDDPYPVDTSPALAKLLRDYSNSHEPVAVSFRQLVHWLKVGERVTHYLHAYPAKLFPHLAHFFLASNLLIERDDSVLDPFAGTGTVPLEVILSGRQALFADSNPLARLITKAKTTAIDDSQIFRAAQHIRTQYCASRTREQPDVVNVKKWFDSRVATQLTRLRAAIHSVEDPDIYDFMRATFSSIVRKASNSDPRFSVPVLSPVLKGTERNVWALFEKQLTANRARLSSLSSCKEISVATLVGCDARKLVGADSGSELADGSVGAIITSPPYAGAQKYVRATSLSLGWLELASVKELRALEDRTIGREHFAKVLVGLHASTGMLHADKLIQLIATKNPIRATIAATYLLEMRDALAEAVRVLKAGGFFVLIIGDNTICGHRFPSSVYLRQMLEQLGLRTVLELIDPIPSRFLMTNRAATSGLIAHETVIVLQKR